MYDKIFNTLAVLTIGGVAFIIYALPQCFEPMEAKMNQANVSIPQIEVSTPDMSKVIHQKAVDDAYMNLSGAMALFDSALSIKPVRHFEPYTLVYVGEFYITMYAATVEQCGNDLGITASGRMVTDDPKCHTVAVDPAVIPLGSYLIIEGYDGIIFRADDTGSAINGYDIDIFTTDEAESKNFNNQSGVKVWIIKD